MALLGVHMSVTSELTNEVEGEIVPERHGDSDVMHFQSVDKNVKGSKYHHKFLWCFLNTAEKGNIAGASWVPCFLGGQGQYFSDKLSPRRQLFW